jgi:DNA-binding beta-propeller fold protein YncE/mono/diheme cytochrome c family protein
MTYLRWGSISLGLFVVSLTATAQSSVDELVARGQELFHADIGCRVCHADTGAGLVGPSLLFGPTPADIFDQLESNPIMGVIVQEMNPSDEDLAAISMYIRTLAGLPLEEGLAEQWATSLAAVKSNQAERLEFDKTPRDLQVEAIERFSSVQDTWTRRSKEGSVWSEYDSRIVATWDPGEPKFEPQPGKTYWYENVGTTSSPSVLFDGYQPPKSNSLVVGDAETMEIIAHYEIPEILRSVVHTSAMSPDGKYAYLVGPREPGPDGAPNPAGDTTMIVLDAVTLQHVAQVTIGARLHHGQVFRDKVLFDMFARDPGGLGMIIFDPETNEVLGGVSDLDMGGFIYTVWTDAEYEFIYALMEPAGYAPGRGTGMQGVTMFNRGDLTAMRPFWLAKIDPDTWEVVAEFPVPGYRGNWVVVDAANEYAYPIMSSSSVSKMDVNTGEIIWTTGSGIGPYGGSLNADESELWIADKGEAAHHLGRTITVIDTHEGHAVETLYGAYKVDHVLLSPNGKEMWATSNGEGRIYVYDAESKDLLKIIDMPGNGDAHGLIWVHYDENGEPVVVRDQGNFHGGINPALGQVLDY